MISGRAGKRIALFFLLLLLVYIATGVLTVIAYRSLQYMPDNSSAGLYQAISDLAMLNGFRQFAYAWYLAVLDNHYFIDLLYIFCFAVCLALALFARRLNASFRYVTCFIATLLLAWLHWQGLPFSDPSPGMVNLVAVEHRFLSKHTQAISADSDHVFLAVTRSSDATEIIIFDHGLAFQRTCLVPGIFVSDMSAHDNTENLVLFGSSGQANLILEVAKENCEPVSRQITNVDGFTTFGTSDDAGHIWAEVVVDGASHLTNLDNGTVVTLPDLPRGGIDYYKGQFFKFSGVSILSADTLNLAIVGNAADSSVHFSKQEYPEYYGVESEGVAVTDTAIYLALNYNYGDGAIWKLRHDVLDVASN
jgi:hypothetical protein